VIAELPIGGDDPVFPVAFVAGTVSRYSHAPEFRRTLIRLAPTFYTPKYKRCWCIRQDFLRCRLL